MPERTSAFEAYLNDLEKKKKGASSKGKIAREGRLATAIDELSEKNEDDQEIDIVA